MVLGNIELDFQSLKCSLIIFALNLSLVCASNLDDLGSTSWSRLEISPNEFCAMPYRSYIVKIYEHFQNNKNDSSLPYKKYYFAPTRVLKHDSAVSDFNKITKKYQMEFEVEMWNNDVKARVIEHLEIVTKGKIERHQVQVLPFEQVILKITNPSTLFVVNSIWLPIDQLDQVIKFSLTCLTQKDCDVLAETMIKEPGKFRHFRLHFAVSSLHTQKRQTNIRIWSSMEGDVKNKLLQQFPDKQEAYMKADDLNRLVAETRTNILKETFTDSEVVMPNSQNAVEKILRDMILSSNKRIEQYSDKIWESVFWNEDNARPDKTSKQLNEIFKSLSIEDQNQVKEDISQSNSFAVGGTVGFGGVSVGTNVENSNSNSKSKDLQTFKKLFNENRENVEFNGEKFVAKRLDLRRINLSKLRDSQSAQDKTIQIDYVTAVLSSAININDKEDKFLAPDEWTTLQSTLSTITKNFEALGFQTSAFKSAVLALKKQLDDFETERKNRNVHANRRGVADSVSGGAVVRGNRK